MIDRGALTAVLAREVDVLVDDLRVRRMEDPQVGGVVAEQWWAARGAGRTDLAEEVWAEDLLTQVAVAWVLACVFVRFCEDNGLVRERWLSGPGKVRRRCAEAQSAWYREHPGTGDRNWLAHVIEAAAALPGLDRVLGAHNPVRLFGPSDDAVRRLVDLWRAGDPASGELVWDFRDDERSTRFLGDLYQDLSASARDRYALLQTPSFVETFLLERTLEPAIDEFGLEAATFIDPACGSGHLMLGAFGRLVERWQERDPSLDPRTLAARALDAVHGVDLNPFAVAIARFRLLVAGLRVAGVRTLAEAPNFALHVATGDSLLRGPAPGQQSMRDVDESDPAVRHLYATEDGEEADRILTARYVAVCANPPYITPKDPAANQAYRRRYPEVCYRQYAMTVPFMQRLFDLAHRGSRDRPAGFVGQITANSFMKREFGKKLIEEFLATRVQLTGVVDTSGAYIPGHGTPTVILFGRNQAPSATAPVRAVLGIRGEPSRPANPAKGEVWRSIVELIDTPGARNEYVSVSSPDARLLKTHPWSLQGGGATELRRTLEGGRLQLEESVRLIGYTGQTNADPVFLSDAATLTRVGVEMYRPWVVGEEVRDYNIDSHQVAVFPYSDGGLIPEEDLPGAVRKYLWPSRQQLWARRTFNKRSYREDGRIWYEWHQVSLDRLLPPNISFANVATHNHFALDRAGLLFNSHAPFMKLSEGAGEDEHLELLGLLNSAVACFWMKQVFHNKGRPGAEQAAADEPFEHRFEFDGTKLKRFPIAAGSALQWAQRLQVLADELDLKLPAGLLSAGVPTVKRLAEGRERAAAIRGEMVALQEELDWRCAYLYGLSETDLSLAPDRVPAVGRGERAFEIVLARKVSAGEVQTAWFAMRGGTPTSEVPSEWPEEYRRLVERRIELIESDRFVGLVERPEYKRPWNWVEWDVLEAEALRAWLLDRLEDRRYWPRVEPRSVAELADEVRRDAEFVQVAELYRRTPDADLVELIDELARGEAVPYLAAWRYTEAGLRTRAQWERTWDLQRAEDAGEDVGAIPVPPKYGKSDFRRAEYWPLRGKLDVPKERFVAYPGLEREADPTMVVGWAGWDHLDQAKALAWLLSQRVVREGWDAERVRPVLAGLAELVPWLVQWHNDVDPATGQQLGGFFAAFVEGERARYGFSAEDLADWRPPEQRRRGRRRKAGS